MAAHQSAVLRRDAAGQETLLNLLLRSYLEERLYDQVGPCYVAACQACDLICAVAVHESAPRAAQHTAAHTPAC